MLIVFDDEIIVNFENVYTFYKHSRGDIHGIQFKNGISNENIINSGTFILFESKIIRDISFDTILLEYRQKEKNCIHVSTKTKKES